MGCFDSRVGSSGRGRVREMEINPMNQSLRGRLANLGSATVRRQDEGRHPMSVPRPPSPQTVSPARRA